LLPDVIDGGPPIVRLPARVDELRAAGHHIEHAGRRNRCAIYRLTSLPAPVVQAPAIDDPAALGKGQSPPRRTRPLSGGPAASGGPAPQKGRGQPWPLGRQKWGAVSWPAPVLPP
jgi:hypothetical protein